MNQILGARVEAVEAEDAVACVYLTGGFASAFAPRVAGVALGTVRAGLSDPPERKPRKNPEQGAQRADNPAVKTRKPEIQEDG